LRCFGAKFAVVFGGLRGYMYGLVRIPGSVYYELFNDLWPWSGQYYNNFINSNFINSRLWHLESHATPGSLREVCAQSQRFSMRPASVHFIFTQLESCGKSVLW